MRPISLIGRVLRFWIAPVRLVAISALLPAGLLLFSSGSAIAQGADASHCVTWDVNLSGVYIGNSCNFPITFKYCIASATMTCSPDRYLTWMHALGPNQSVRVMYNQYKETRVQTFGCRLPAVPREKRRIERSDPLYHAGTAALFFTCS
jgi:hypothetical protein